MRFVSFKCFFTEKLLSYLILVIILIPIYIRAEENNKLKYFELGITTSTMIIHPSIGYWWDKVGIRLNGMYLSEDRNELHLNIGYAFYDTKNLQQSINILTSWVVGSDPGADYKYGSTGIAYSFNYKGIFLEFGLASPWRDDLGNLEEDPVIPCGYFGYIYRFR